VTADEARDLLDRLARDKAASGDRVLATATTDRESGRPVVALRAEREADGCWSHAHGVRVLPDADPERTIADLVDRVVGGLAGLATVAR
jgi:hypothetical protein